MLLWLVRGQSFYLAWQLLFMTGVLAGYHFVYLKNLFFHLSPHWQLGIYRLVLFSAVAAVSLSCLAVFYFHWQSQFFDKNTLGFGRFCLAWLVFSALFGLFRKNEAFIHRFTHGALALLGRNSLFTYALHAVVIFPNSLFFPLPGTFWLNTLLCLLVLILVYLPIYFLSSIRLQAVSRRTLRQFPFSLKIPE